MDKHLTAVVLAGSAALALLAAGSVQAQPKPPLQCFNSTDWNGWKATPDSRVIYIRVGVNRIYRLDLVDSCPELQDANARLITHVNGPETVCSALDLDLKVSSQPGFSTACMVSKLSQLSPDEAAALPKNLRP